MSVSGVAWSEEGAGGSGGSQGAKGDGHKFQERKAEILKKVEARLAEIQKRHSCVQAASNPQDLKACRPQGGGKDDQ
ncbi:MAG TPA: hypothetical protein HPQ00_03065 [Magnetococcales bacterium]|nr:hypothetical protein [Magnetococcales bacterium]